MLAGVTTVGRRRCGEGPAGEIFDSNVTRACAWRVARGPGRGRARGQRRRAAAGRRARDRLRDPAAQRARRRCRTSGRCGCCAPTCWWCSAPRSWRRRAPRARDDLAAGPPRPDLACELGPEPAEPLPAGARVAASRPRAREAEPAARGAGAARRRACASSPPTSRAAASSSATSRRALRERLRRVPTELKAAAIDTVAERAARAGAQVVFLRNRPSRIPGEPELDDALAGLVELAPHAPSPRRGGAVVSRAPARAAIRPRSSCAATTGCPTRRG